MIGSLPSGPNIGHIFGVLLVLLLGGLGDSTLRPKGDGPNERCLGSWSIADRTKELAIKNQCVFMALYSAQVVGGGSEKAWQGFVCATTGIKHSCVYSWMAEANLLKDGLERELHLLEGWPPFQGWLWQPYLNLAVPRHPVP